MKSGWFTRIVRYNLSYSRFCYWRIKFNKEKQAESTFIPIATGRLASSATITLPGGIEMEVPADTLSDVPPMIFRSVQGCSDVPASQ